MRIVAITKVLDEADIVEAFVRHTAAFVDHHVVLDNGSRDETPDILRALASEGIRLTVFQGHAVSFNEENYNTFLYRWAWTTLRPDWMVFLDADEFIDDRGHEGGLAAALATLGARAEPTNLKMPMTNYYPDGGDEADDLLVPRRMRLRAAATPIHKVTVDGRFDALATIVNDGNHDAKRGDDALPSLSVPGLTIAHYPERSAPQRIVKYLRGWAKVLAAGQPVIGRGTSYHYGGFWKGTYAEPHQQFRDSSRLMTKDRSDLVEDPIAYRGGPLRYTPEIDAETRVIRLLMDYVEDLATSHGELLDAVPGARHYVERKNLRLRRLHPDPGPVDPAALDPEPIDFEPVDSGPVDPEPSSAMAPFVRSRRPWRDRLDALLGTLIRASG